MKTIGTCQPFTLARWLTISIAFFALTEPHDGNKNRWMLRAEDSEYFDKWSNASYEEFYDTVDDFINPRFN